MLDAIVALWLMDTVRRNGARRIDIVTQAAYSGPVSHEEEARHSSG